DRGVDAAVALLDLAALAELGGGRLPEFRPPARLPGIKVDVALALPAAVSYAEAEASVRAAGGKLLESLELFDLFEGPPLAEGQRSLAFHAVLRAADRTLEDTDERRFLEKAAKAATELGGGLRQ
ncbi:MAG: phenylalanine--tRNA ligase subunit beta, partial [Planctomycetes bacterium]|nr:phenylalanine--tRNA ligase subunit beta [Planctomycetota bacterium]